MTQNININQKHEDISLDRGVLPFNTDHQTCLVFWLLFCHEHSPIAKAGVQHGPQKMTGQQLIQVKFKDLVPESQVSAESYGRRGW